MTVRRGKYPGLDPLPPPFAERYPPVAIVEEDSCIACDRCPPVCFFDAIVMEGRPRHKYKRTAVILEENCTGCGLCFEACPVDAIKWIPDKAGLPGPPKLSDFVEDTDL
ncbi:MAG: 4Fe-4S binding protein [Ignavibacterium sp.]|jgi:formate hydrogenlyase subunit 6/NADH:ubiquinone oxidoreductase subunit I